MNCPTLARNHQRTGSPTTAGTEERLIERFAPDAEFGESHETRVGAPADLTFEVAETFDLTTITPVYAIFWLRARIMRATLPKRGDLAGLVAATKRMGWGELARRPRRELVMGAAVQPWLAEPVFEAIAPERFAAYGDPEHVKIVWTLEAEPVDSGTALLRTETRVVPTDAAARRRFHRYWLVAGAGIVLIRLLALPAIRREAERRWRESNAPEGSSRELAAPLLERALPLFDATIVRQTVVEAPPAVTYQAIFETNLLDRVVRSLFAIRELPSRALSRLRGEAPPSKPRSITLTDFLGPETGMVRVAEEPGVEVVIGSVGRFWEKDYGHRQVSADDFANFREPGFAKLAMDFRVRPGQNGKSILRYEARTVTTDDEASRRFGWYWRLIRPGVWLVMGRAVSLVRREAERRARMRGT